MEAPERARLERRRDLWRRYRDTGELPETPPAERIAEARRHRRTYWWTDAWEEEEEEGRPPPEDAPSPLGVGLATAQSWRGSLIQGITPAAVAA